MFYYEIWFYYWPDDDERTDYTKEFTFYCKTAEPIETTEAMIRHLKNTFPPSDEYSIDQINCIDPKHYEFLSDWFEIDEDSFIRDSGIEDGEESDALAEAVGKMRMGEGVTQ